MTKPVAYSEEWRKKIADQNTILRVQIGSRLHGLQLEGVDDRDEMGICIEPPECVLGHQTFSQYQYRTQPDGVRSGPGDLDLNVYGLRKWAYLAAQGNPTKLLALFVPEEHVLACDQFGQALLRNHRMFVTKHAGIRFLRYTENQRDQMLGLKSKQTNRPELIEQFGYDTKFAYHAVRVAIQGTELMYHGRITLPVPEPEHSWLMAVRNGHVSKQDVMSRIEHEMIRLDSAIYCSELPEEPDMNAVNTWISNMYLEWWSSKEMI